MVDSFFSSPSPSPYSSLPATRHSAPFSSYPSPSLCPSSTSIFSSSSSSSLSPSSSSSSLISNVYNSPECNLFNFLLGPRVTPYSRGSLLDSFASHVPGCKSNNFRFFLLSFFFILLAMINFFSESLQETS